MFIYLNIYFALKDHLFNKTNKNYNKIKQGIHLIKNTKTKN